MAAHDYLVVDEAIRVRIRHRVACGSEKGMKLRLRPKASRLIGRKDQRSGATPAIGDLESAGQGPERMLVVNGEVVVRFAGGGGTWGWRRIPRRQLKFGMTPKRPSSVGRNDTDRIDDFNRDYFP